MSQTCDTCSGPFVTERIGQFECPQCVRVSEIRSSATEEIGNLVIDTSSALETCRDYAEDALALLSGERLSAKNKEALRVILEHIRTDATDAIPDAGDYLP